jgi:hypothetical protein
MQDLRTICVMRLGLVTMLHNGKLCCPLSSLSPSPPSTLIKPGKVSQSHWHRGNRDGIVQQPLSPGLIVNNKLLSSWARAGKAISVRAGMVRYGEGHIVDAGLLWSDCLT